MGGRCQRKTPERLLEGLALGWATKDANGYAVLPHSPFKNGPGVLIRSRRLPCRRLNSNPGHFGLSIGFPESFLAPAGGHPMQGKGSGKAGVLKVCQPLPDRIGVDPEIGSNLLGAKPAALTQDGKDVCTLAGSEFPHPGCRILACAWV